MITFQHKQSCTKIMKTAGTEYMVHLQNLRISRKLCSKYSFGCLDFVLIFSVLKKIFQKSRIKYRQRLQHNGALTITSYGYGYVKLILTNNFDF